MTPDDDEYAHSKLSRAINALRVSQKNGITIAVDLDFEDDAGASKYGQRAARCVSSDYPWPTNGLIG